MGNFNHVGDYETILTMLYYYYFYIIIHFICLNFDSWLSGNICLNTSLSVYFFYYIISIIKIIFIYLH